MEAKARALREEERRRWVPQPIGRLLAAAQRARFVGLVLMLIRVPSALAPQALARFPLQPCRYAWLRGLQLQPTQLRALANTRAAHAPAPPPAAPHRKLAELEAKLIEEETAARIAAAVEAKVAEALASEAVQQSLQRRLEGERAQLEQQVRWLAGGWGSSQRRPGANGADKPGAWRNRHAGGGSASAWLLRGEGWRPPVPHPLQHPAGRAASGLLKRRRVGPPPLQPGPSVPHLPCR